MALIADSMGWEPQGGDEPDAFVIRLRAESEADRPDDCPRGRDECDGCRAFMGHRKEPPAYAGEAVRFCCADRF